MTSTRSNLIPALAAMVSILAMAGPAEAQNGYRGYIGPYTDVYANDAYAPVSRNVPPGAISLGYDFVHSPKGREMMSEAREYVAEHPQARYLLSEADDYVHSPMAKQHFKRVKKAVTNPKGYRTVENVQRFMTTPSETRDELLSQVSSGSNFDFLATNVVGYLRTGQVDLIEDNLIVYQGGTLEPQTYKVKNNPYGRMIIDGPNGQMVGRVDRKGDEASVRLMSHGLAVPVRINNYMPRLEGKD